MSRSPTQGSEFNVLLPECVFACAHCAIACLSKLLWLNHRAVVPPVQVPGAGWKAEQGACCRAGAVRHEHTG